MHTEKCKWEEMIVRLAYEVDSRVVKFVGCQYSSSGESSCTLQPPSLGRKYAFSGSRDFVHRGVGEGKPKTGEGGGEGRCRDGHDGVAPPTLPMIKSCS